MDKLFKKEPLFYSVYKKEGSITSLKEHEKFLKTKELNLLIYYKLRIYLKSTDIHTSILFQNFIQSTYAKPSFENNIILFNDSSTIDENIKFIFSKLPFQYIVSENLFNHISEKNIHENEEFNNRIEFGFHIYINKQVDSKELFTLYDYITPFLIVENKIKIIPKKNILKYVAFLIAENEYINFSGLFLSSSNFVLTNEELVNDIINKFELTQTKEEVITNFSNNNILIKKSRKTFFQILNTYNFPENKISFIELGIDLFFTNLDNELQFYKDLINNCVNLLQIIITNIIGEFNNNVNSIFFKKINDEVYNECIKIKKKIDSTKNYYFIPSKYKIIWKYICDKNNIIFSNERVIIDVNKTLEYDVCLKSMNEFASLLYKSIDENLSNIKDIYKIKNELQ